MREKMILEEALQKLDEEVSKNSLVEQFLGDYLFYEKSFFRMRAARLMVELANLEENYKLLLEEK